ncbi:Tyrosine recombinase XerD [Roseibaca ekhonensis]|uniref:Tyrosine recombinase XerD n=1 Tax=Roseinatronobacter ekhonensis TaxID=254356 RepID=A0A3B0MBS1_9RHOB|nr:tyrosine-type recombinase/integrase [Roseibaca ekhonensis]SUZ33312.1 Tyrosine recombinase XerD [Roseibaca ekhonensis]
MSLIMPIHSWPARDQVLWTSLMQQGGPFDDRGAFAHLRDTSRKTLSDSYGRWLEWLNRYEPDVLGEAPAQRASIERLRVWLAALGHNSNMTRLMFVEGVIRVLSKAEPDADWSRHRKLVAALKRLAGRGDPARKRGRILSSRVLLKAGMDLSGPDADGTSNALQRALKRRDGAMLALLAMMPMRARAFSSLEIGTSLIIRPEGFTIALTEDMTKTGAPWEADVPEPAASALRHYLDVARPFLMARTNQRHDRLWVEKKGAHMRHDTVRLRIAKKTTDKTGIRVPPHFFRDAAATTLARESSEAARLIRPILAHSSFETAEKHYIHAQSLDASRAFMQVVRTRKTARIR